MRVRRETRPVDDGYRCPLVPGLHSSQDARRLAEEIVFANARLEMLAQSPPGLYAEARESTDLEQATWTCMLITYLSPLEGEDPFAGIRTALTDWHSGQEPDLDEVPLGPRSSHVPGRWPSTLEAYRHWALRAGSQEAAFRGDSTWGPERRFERLFERLALPGLGRAGRFDLLVALGGLGLYEMHADALHLQGDDQAVVAAKRVFGIGDRINLERRAGALADAAAVPLEALDLALANWASPERATMGAASAAGQPEVRERCSRALGL